MLGYSLLAGGVLAISPAIAAINRVLSPAPLPIEYQRYADPATICHGQIVGDCLKGDLNSNNEVLVLGDSHAAMLNLFFDQLGKELGFKARIITASSCVTIPDFDTPRIVETARQACTEQITYANKYLAQAKTIFLAASWDWQIKSSVFQKALKNFFKEQSIAGKKIYVMEQVPKLNRNPQRHLRFFGLGLRPEMRIDSSYSFANEWLKQVALEFPAVTTLNFENTGLFKGAPLYQNQLIYMDEHHINEIGAEYYSAMASTSSTLKSILRQLP